MGQNLLQELHAQIAFYANAVYEVNIEVNSQTQPIQKIQSNFLKKKHTKIQIGLMTLSRK